MISGLPPPVRRGTTLTALAPMQNVTDHAFLQVIAEIGPPDYFFTEYFSIHSTTSLDAKILRTVTENQTGRPVFAQILGNDPGALAEAGKVLEKYPVAGVDLNLGCPAPKIYKRNAGGGLLRNLELVEEILRRMRESIAGSFSVKCRLGFSNDDPFEDCVELFKRYEIDFLTIHGRTVKQMYRGDVDYGSMKRAAEMLSCPVFANGNLTSASASIRVLGKTGCHGAMIGRAAIRNPWIFRQIREISAGEAVFRPTLGDVRGYIEKLNLAKKAPDFEERFRIAHLKRYLVFIGQGVDEEGAFLHDIRRISSEGDLFRVCDSHLVDNGRETRPFSDEPFPGVVARPNCETAA